MDFTIRHARPEDAAALIDYDLRLLLEPNLLMPLQSDEFQVTPEGERRLPDWVLDVTKALYLLAEADGKLIGELTCRRRGRRAFSHAVTLAMSVAQEWRNKGVGSRLMAEAIAWAQSRDTVHRIELHVYAENSAAIHLYQKFGFEIEGRRRKAVYQHGRYFDDVIMARLMR